MLFAGPVGTPIDSALAQEIAAAHPSHHLHTGAVPANPPGSLPRPGVQRSFSPFVHGMTTTSNSRAAAVTNAETNLALDLQSFGLQNPQLHHALSSMLKAIVSLSEDHKVVKHQLEQFQNATRDAQTAIAVDLDSVANKLLADYVPRRDWMEGRYEDQRRTDRVSVALAEFQQEQLGSMTGVLPRLAVVEETTAALRDNIAKAQATFAPVHLVEEMLESRDRAATEAIALAGKRAAMLESEVAQLRNESQKAVVALRTDVGTSQDRLEELSREIARLTALQVKLRADCDAVDTALERSTKLHQSSAAALQQRIQALADETNSRFDAVIQGATTIQKATDERLLKTENQFAFQFATVESVTHDHGLRLRSVVSDVETIKGELAATTHTLDVLRVQAEGSGAAVNATLDVKVAEVNELARTLRRDLAALEKNTAKWGDSLRTDIETAVEDLATRFKTSEKRKKAEDDAFRDLVSTSVADETSSLAKTLESRLTAKLKDVVARFEGDAQALLARVDAAVQDRDTRVATCEDITESTVSTLSTLGDAVSRTQQSCADASGTIEALCAMLQVDPEVLRRLSRHVSTTDDDDEARLSLQRYMRSLPWYPARQRSPPRVSYTVEAPVSPLSRQPSPRSSALQVAEPLGMLRHRLGSPSAPPTRVAPTATAVVQRSGAGQQAPTAVKPAASRSFEIQTEDFGQMPTPRPRPGADAWSETIAEAAPTSSFSQGAPQADDGGNAVESNPAFVDDELVALPATHVYAQSSDTSIFERPRMTPPPLPAVGAGSHSPARDGNHGNAVDGSRVDPAPQTRRVSPARPLAALQRSPPPPSVAAAGRNAAPKLGLEINDDESGRGVVVLRVDAGGLADSAGILVGDVITEFAGARVATKQDFVDAFVGTVKAGERAVTVALIPGGRSTAAPTDLTLLLLV